MVVDSTRMYVYKLSTQICVQRSTQTHHIKQKQKETYYRDVEKMCTSEKFSGNAAISIQSGAARVDGRFVYLAKIIAAEKIAGWFIRRMVQKTVETFEFFTRNVCMW